MQRKWDIPTFDVHVIEACVVHWAERHFVDRPQTRRADPRGLVQLERFASRVPLTRHCAPHETAHTHKLRQDRIGVNVAIV